MAVRVKIGPDPKTVAGLKMEAHMKTRVGAETEVTQPSTGSLAILFTVNHHMLIWAELSRAQLLLPFFHRVKPAK